MLNRSLFEDMVDAHWAHLYPDEALERLPQHDRWSRHLRANVQRQFATDFFDGRKPSKQELSKDEVTELRGLFGRKGGGSWTGLDFDERYKATLPYWESEEDRRYMRWFNAWIHKLNNEIVHPSVLSLARLAGPQPTEEGGWGFRFGSTKEWLAQHSPVPTGLTREPSPWSPPRSGRPSSLTTTRRSRGPSTPSTRSPT